jgi:hypothetical protein
LGGGEHLVKKHLVKIEHLVKNWLISILNKVIYFKGTILRGPPYEA